MENGIIIPLTVINSRNSKAILPLLPAAAVPVRNAILIPAAQEENVKFNRSFICWCYCASKKYHKHIDKYLYRQRFMYVGIYSGSGARHEMAECFDWKNIICVRS